MHVNLARFAAVALALSGAGIVFAAMPAHADVRGIETTAHGVVLSSTLVHCTLEDGTGPQELPCTWNVGTPQDGNGKGLSYIFTGHGVDYVWNSSPAKHGWHWSRVDNDCVVRAGHYKCANGDRGVNTGIPA